MMESFAVAAAGAFWFGVLTSISPCPLTTNIVAVSYIGKNVGSAGKALSAGGLYVAGRILAYAAVAGFIVAGVLSTPGVSFFLQKNMHKALGPVLIVSGVLMLGIVRLPSFFSFDAERFRGFITRSGFFGPVLLGLISALAFCPVSAALFFGSLLPLALRHESEVLLPVLYGAGTGLPVIAFAVLLAFGAGSVGKVFDAVAKVERWARILTALIFIGAGGYLIYMNMGL